MMKPKNNLPICALCAIMLVAPAGVSAWMIARDDNSRFDPAVSAQLFRPADDGSRPVPGVAPAPVAVEILPLPEGMDPATLDALIRGIEKWDSLPGSAMQVIAVPPLEGAPYDPDWLVRHANPDGRNTIEFVTQDWSAAIPGNYVGNTEFHVGPSGAILETDIFLNAEDFEWMVFQKLGSFPGLADWQMVDVEAIVTHETGHVLALGHSQVKSACMYDFAGLADTRARRLTIDDLDAIRFLYPATAADQPPPSVWRVSKDGYSDNACGMTEAWMTLIALPTYYHHNLVETLPFAGDLDYCVFGAGFSPGLLADMDLEVDGVPLGAVTNVTYVGPNFVKATVTNAGALPAGAYDLSVTHAGGATGLLSEGLIMNPAGNGLPVAVIQPLAEHAAAGTAVYLDGRPSYDPEGAPLTYRWSLVESPLEAQGVLSSTGQAVTALGLPAPGAYVVRLVVGDGLVEGAADQVVIRAEYSLRKSDDGGDDPINCAGSIDRERLSTNQGGLAGLIVLLAPLAAALLIRRAVANGRQAARQIRISG